MPASTAILRPVFALAGWTLCILLLLAFRRVSKGLAKGLSPEIYALGESAQVPPSATLANRNYMNLLELPLLFYVLCLMAQLTSTVSPQLIWLAWAYVLLRVLHSLIHVSYNRVLHRFAAFAASNLVLALMWTLQGLALLGQGAAI